MPSRPATDPSLTRAPADGRWSRVRAPLLLGAGVAAATVALHLRDPHAEGSWGVCPLFAATGIYCPGCGGLRAVNDLTNLDLAGAASSNLLFVLAVPFLLVGWVLWVRARWSGRPMRDLRQPLRFTLVLGVVLVAFTVVRNLPFGAWLAP